MENDKSEWDKILKERDQEISSLAAYDEQLEHKIKALESDIVTSSNRHKQREEFLQNQVKDAHAAQVAVEDKLTVQQRLSETYRNDVIQLREKESTQTAEISILQAKLARAEQERDPALAEKAAAEEAHERTKADINSDLFEFYVHSVIGKGSLSFLDPKYEITLAEVRERILEETKDGNYSEEEIMVHFLDSDARVALASGKEKLAQERAALSGTELPEKLIVHDPTVSASSTDIIIVPSSLPSQTTKVTSTLIEGETQVATEQASQEDKDESDDARQFEIKARDPHSPGNIIDSAQEDFLPTPFEFEAYLDYCLGLYILSSPLLANNTDVTFSSLIAATPGATESTPPPVDTSLVSEATPGHLSELGPQSEVIAAMTNIDDPVSSLEAGGDSDTEGGEKTPEAVTSLVSTEATPKRRKKLVISKDRKTTSSGKEEGSGGKKARPGKLSIKPSDSSKGGMKKK